jgi:hypothetical protein
MNEYQKVFLFYVFIYYLFKGGICIACVLALNRMMKKALERKKRYTLLYMQRRSEEEERWRLIH